MDNQSPAPPAPYEDELLGLLDRLISIPSVNPGLDPTGTGEGQMADFLQEWAKNNGLESRRIGDDRPSIILTNATQHPGAPTILFGGHLDTVGFGQMSNPLAPTRVGDQIHGRGAYDMKSGMAASLIAMRELAANHDINVVVAMVADEEFGSRGMEQTLPFLTADYAIVAEMTELQIGVAHKGFVWLDVLITGKAAHGSRPDLGVDAIMNAGHVLVALQALDASLRSRQHPLLGSPNLHASLITGGIEESTIPDECRIILERRTLPGETSESVLAEVQQAVFESISGLPGVTAEVTVIQHRHPFEIDPANPLVQALTAAAHQHGTKAPTVGVSYWADSALIAETGVPTVLFGPSGEGAHAQVEWVSAESIVKLAQIFITAAASLGASAQSTDSRAAR
ncbi:M20/M25/M40 family metallo-hydrolase [Mycobacterium sp. 155]|uniref:M20/M25/M40 family metallo-hydrolase n=1 Tax=Mycobacterium sp. 155 TaxID=1157943 RepID=UPI00037BE015|nr:M20/M25/M40 family metallo-hydrolase [Mycobacterium sp. 155]